MKIITSERIIWILLIFIFFMIGGVVQRNLDFVDGTSTKPSPEEIRLKIPIDDNSLKRQILKVTAQKAILDQLEKWWSKEKDKHEKLDKK